MDNAQAQKPEEMLQHAFRVEDYAISILIKEIQASEISVDHAGHVAKKVLEIVSQAYSRKELADLVDHATEEYPELKELSVQEHMFVKAEAERIIKQAIENLLAVKNIDDALKLAQTISAGDLPEELRLKIEAI